jgi:hypothetical protein
MYQLSSQEYWACFFSEFRCRNCGSDAGYLSRPRNFFERRIVPILLMKMVRCGDCYHRSFRPLNVKVRPRRVHMNFDPVRAVSDLVHALPPKESAKELPEPANDSRRIA